MILSGPTYSYVRFSKQKQSEGDSYRRQIELRNEFLEKHNLTLHEKTYEDLGVSAFKGDNLKEGALGVFLKAIESGVIKKGSILIVESLDRISRQHPMLAQALFLRIINHGITIVTLLDNQIYSEERMHKEQGMPLIFSLVYMMRAHDESAKKSQRVRDGLKSKRTEAADRVVSKKTGKVQLLSTAPAWLKKNADRTGWEIIPEKARIVRRIFELAEQNMGAHKIVHQLNFVDRMPTLRNAARWSAGNVSSVMANSAAMGTLVMKVEAFREVENYYPPVVSKEQFNRVQHAMEVRSKTGGIASDKVSNLFSGISYCLYCKGRTRFVVSAGGNYVHCLASYQRDPACSARPLPYKAVETAILDRLMNIQARTLRAGKAELDKKTILREEVEQLKAQQKQAIELLLKMPDVTPLQDKLIKLQAQIKATEGEISAHGLITIPVKEAQAAAELFAHHKSIAESDTPELHELRRSMQVAIRRQLKKIEFAANFSDSELFKTDGLAYFDGMVSEHRQDADVHCLVKLTYTSGKARIVNVDPFIAPRTMKARANKKAA